jgi:hypothetical protein
LRRRLPRGARATQLDEIDSTEDRSQKTVISDKSSCNY